MYQSYGILKNWYCSVVEFAWSFCWACLFDDLEMRMDLKEVMIECKKQKAKEL